MVFSLFSQYPTRSYACIKMLLMSYCRIKWVLQKWTKLIAKTNEDDICLCYLYSYGQYGVLCIASSYGREGLGALVEILLNVNITCHSAKLITLPNIQHPSICSSIHQHGWHQLRSLVLVVRCQTCGHLRWVLQGIPKIRSLCPPFWILWAKVNYSIVTNETDKCP